MSKWGKRLEYSEAELRVILSLSARELYRQITQTSIDPVLANVVKKVSRILAPKGDMAGLGRRDVVVGGKVIATLDNVSVEVIGGNREELAELQEETVILLVKPANFAVKEVQP